MSSEEKQGQCEHQALNYGGSVRCLLTAGHEGFHAYNKRFADLAQPSRTYFCSCGGACTAEEYIHHYFDLGHDRGERPVGLLVTLRLTANPVNFCPFCGKRVSLTDNAVSGSGEQRCVKCPTCGHEWEYSRGKLCAAYVAKAGPEGIEYVMCSCKCVFEATGPEKFQYEAELRNRLSLAAGLIRDAEHAVANIPLHFRDDVSGVVQRSYATLNKRLSECADRLAQPLSTTTGADSGGEREDPHVGYDCGGTCVIHRFAGPAPSAAPKTQQQGNKIRVLMCSHCEYDMRMAEEIDDYEPPDGHRYNEQTCTREVNKKPTEAQEPDAHRKAFNAAFSKGVEPEPDLEINYVTPDPTPVDEGELSPCAPCPWCRATADEKDEWGWLITHAPTCYWLNTHGDPIGRVRVNFSQVEQWNQSRTASPVSQLCVCDHPKAQHIQYSDHDECLGCVGRDEPCSEFRAAVSPPVGEAQTTTPFDPAAFVTAAIISDSGGAWRQWFTQVGAHATVDVVKATADLVLAERSIIKPSPPQEQSDDFSNEAETIARYNEIWYEVGPASKTYKCDHGVAYAGPLMCVKCVARMQSTVWPSADTEEQARVDATRIGDALYCDCGAQVVRNEIITALESLSVSPSPTQTERVRAIAGEILDYVDTNNEYNTEGITAIILKHLNTEIGGGEK